MTLLRKLPAISLALAVGAASGCAPAADDTGDELAVTCEGKCDGLSSVHSLLADARKLDLNDLLAIGAGQLWEQAAKQLNRSIGGVSFASVQLQAPKAYGLSSDAANDLTLGDLSQLVSGLASQYGERELTTQVNRLRAAELGGRPGSVFAESAFTLDTGINGGWTLGTQGFDNTRATIGFDASKSNEMRLIQRVDQERDAYLLEPLRAVLASRAFVMPVSVDDVALMQPGELIARSGSGTVAINLGLSVPLLVTSPAVGIGYGLLFNAALRTQIRADRMDVQIARMAGDEVVVDVGVRDGQGVSWRVAVEDGWGTLGVPGAVTLMNKVTVELAKLAEKALGKALGARGQLFSASLAGSSGSARVSVSRLRFNLGSLDAAGKEAFAQALYGDLRLAQALAWQKHAGVAQDFDLFRSGESATSYAGVDILGMRFFAEKKSAQGEIVIDGPGGARALLFNTLQRQDGWFFATHGYNRVGLGGLSFDADGSAHTETNLFVQAMHGDKFMERDALLDHVDAALLEIGGRPALDAVETLGNQIERYVQATCNTNDAYSPCMKSVLGDDNVTGPRARATAALETAIAGLPADAQDLARRLGALRLAANAAHEFPAVWVGPSASVVLDYRIDDAALSTILGADGQSKLTEAIYAYLETTNVDRESTTPLPAQRTKIRSDKRTKVEALGAILASLSVEYQRLASAESTSVEGIGTIGGRALELRFGLDSSGRVDYDHALARSFAEGRMSVATSLFDQLRNAAGGLGPYVEEVVANGLLGATPTERRDVRFTVGFKLPSESDATSGHYVTAGYANVDGYAKAPQAAPINGGLFNIDALLKTE
jgi:hypothetical protein